MRIVLSLSDAPIGLRENALVLFFSRHGCKTVKEKYNAKANVYNCTNWSLDLLKIGMSKLGWEENVNSFPDKLGNYHIVNVATDEMCVASPSRGNFVLEFMSL